MSEPAKEPISIRVDVGGQIADILIVGDPRDSMLAHALGRAVSVAVMELGEEIATKAPR